LVALANIEDESVVKKSFVHVTSRTPFAVSWLTALGIDAGRIIDHTVIAAKELYVPEMGRCGAPFYSQLEWLQHRMAVLYPSTAPDNSTEGHSVVLIRRTRSRTVSNHMQVESTVRTFSTARGLPFHVHSDDHLPSLPDQIRLFARARIVVAPHGAGELFVNFLLPGACVVELISLSNTCLAYSRVAYVKRMHYIQCFMDANHGHRVDEKELAVALEGCFKAVRDTGAGKP
jgi:capsular polysaccharide biosynthesis protein